MKVTFTPTDPGEKQKLQVAGATRGWGMTLTDRDRKIVLVLVPVLLAAAYWFLLLAPKRDEASKLGEELAQAESARDDAVARADAVSSAKGGFAADFAEVLRIGKAIPSTVDMPSLLVQLDKAATGTSIGFNSIKAGQRTDRAAARHPQRAPTGAPHRPLQAASRPRARPVGGGRAGQRAPPQTSDQANAAAGADPAAGTDAPPPAARRASTPCRWTSPSAGDFFELADFFHRLKRFVHVNNDRIVVDGRLMLVESFSLKMLALPDARGDDVDQGLPVAEGGGRDRQARRPPGPATAPASSAPAGGTAPAPAPTPTVRTEPMTNFLLDIWSDLREKRLWPVAVALLVALVAVPVVLTKPAEEVAPAAAPTAVGAPSGPASAGQLLPADLEAAKPLLQTSTLSEFDSKDPFKPLKALETVEAGRGRRAHHRPTPWRSGEAGGTGPPAAAPAPTAGQAPSVQEEEKTVFTYQAVVELTTASGAKKRVVNRLGILPERQEPAARLPRRQRRRQRRGRVPGGLDRHAGRRGPLPPERRHLQLPLPDQGGRQRRAHLHDRRRQGVRRSSCSRSGAWRSSSRSNPAPDAQAGAAKAEFAAVDPDENPLAGFDFPLFADEEE